MAWNFMSDEEHKAIESRIVGCTTLSQVEEAILAVEKLIGGFIAEHKWEDDRYCDLLEAHNKMAADASDDHCRGLEGDIRRLNSLLSDTRVIIKLTTVVSDQNDPSELENEGS